MIEIVSRLPAEYQEVTHIQSSGTQHINSNYKPTSEKLRIVCEFEYTAAHNSASVFGSQSGQHWSIVAYGSPAFYVGNGGGGNLLPQTTSLNTKYVLDVTADNGKLTVNLNGTVQTATYNKGLLTTQNIGIFCNIINGVAQQLCSMKLYRMLIYDNDVLVREYYPCYRKSDNVNGLIDLVHSVFYTNAGTGAFTRGADSNTLTTVVVTEGGVIPKKWALRRRLVGSDLPTSNVNVQLTGTFTATGTASVTIEGVAYSSSQTVSVPQGTVITLYIPSDGWYNPTTTLQIIVNGTAVVDNPAGPISYNYTVNSDCAIEGYVVNSRLRLKLTSS